MGLLEFAKKLEPKGEHKTMGAKFAHTLYDGFFTFLYAPASVTKGGVHLRDGMDLKRLMVSVVVALQLCYLFGSWNIGHQHFLALGEHTDLLAGFHLKLWHGLVKLLPMFVVSNVVGLGIEFYFAAKKGHAIEEGYLVTGALIPLVMPPDLPLWILALSIIFAVVIGKEAFGGTGMNVVNIALLARVFIFFAYPTTISGDEVWVSALAKTDIAAGTQYVQNGLAMTAGEGGILTRVAQYGWAHDLGNFLFGLFGWAKFNTQEIVATIDGYSGATPLALGAKGGWAAISEKFTLSQIVWGTTPGSIGETCKPFIIAGALVLAYLGIASWRIMVSMLLGCAITGYLFNIWGFSEWMQVPWYYHIFMGSFLFAMAFMATDPVTASSTNTGKWYYGFFIGVVGMVVRVLNPAYPEGWMLAILFMNVFSPLIDHFVIQANISKRLSRVQAK